MKTTDENLDYPDAVPLDRKTGVVLSKQLDRASRTEDVQAFDSAAQLAAGRWCYWLQLTLSSWNALCCMVVGLVTTMSG